MSCLEIRELLSPYIDGMLEQAELKQVEEHLASCSHCQQELAELQYVLGLLQEPEVCFAPAGFSQQVMERLNPPLTGSTGWKQRISKLISGKSWGQIAAVAAMLVIAAAVTLDLRQAPEFSLSALDKSKSLSQEALPKSPEMASQSAGQEGLTNGLAKQDNALPEQSTFSRKATQEAVTGAASQPAAQDVTDGERQLVSPKMSTANQAGTGTPPAADRKIIKNGRVELAVTNIEKANTQISEKVKSFQGYIESSSIYNSPQLVDGQVNPGAEQARSGNLVIRIPVDQFEKFFAQVKAMGKVVFQEMRGQDVSSEFYDTQARIRNWKQQETRLLEILKQAKNVEEILRVENELQRVRQEVEVMEGRLKSLANLSEMATLEITLTQVKDHNAITLPEQNVFQQAGAAFISSVNELIDTAGNLVIALGGVAPVLILLGLIIGGAICYRRWKFKHPKE